MLLITPKNLQFSPIHPGESKKQSPFEQQLLDYQDGDWQINCQACWLVCTLADTLLTSDRS